MRPRRSAQVGAARRLLVGALVILCIGWTGCSPREPRVAALAAPAWAAEDLAGAPRSLSELRGKVVLLDFWATWCAPCRQEIPEYIALQTRHAGDGLVVVGMSLDTLPVEAVREFVRKAGINYAVVVADAEIAAAYAVEALPTTVLIDREGRIRHRKVGAMTDPKAYAESVRALVAERGR